MDQAEMERRLLLAISQLDDAFEQTKIDARRIGREPCELRTRNGDYVVIPILVARAQTLSALVTLKSLS